MVRDVFYSSYNMQHLCAVMSTELNVIFWTLFPPQDRKLSVIERPAGGGRPATLHFLSRPTVSRVISWEAVVRGDALYIEIPREPLPEGSKERSGVKRGNV